MFWILSQHYKPNDDEFRALSSKLTPYGCHLLPSYPIHDFLLHCLPIFQLHIIPFEDRTKHIPVLCSNNFSINMSTFRLSISFYFFFGMNVKFIHQKNLYTTKCIFYTLGAIPNSLTTFQNEKAIYNLVWNQNCISFSVPLTSFILNRLILFLIPLSINLLSTGNDRSLSPCLSLLRSHQTAYRTAWKAYLIQKRLIFSLVSLAISSMISDSSSFYFQIVKNQTMQVEWISDN